MTNHAQSVCDQVLALHPTKAGFGWVLFDGPLAPLEWGTASASPPDRNAHALERIEELVVRFRPSEIVLEQFEGEPAKRKPRIVKLYRSIVALAQKHGLKPRIFGRDVIEQVFRPFKAKNRYHIASAIASHIDAFAHQLPPNRKIWDAENPRMGLFNAAALAITYFVVVDGATFPA
jgi:hypothetical protein